MLKVELSATHQALFDVAKSEYRYLVESKEHDGFDLSELEVLNGTDEELHIAFSLNLNGTTMYFLYSLGFDPDEGRYMPYVTVDVGEEQNPDFFSTKQFGSAQAVEGDEDLLDSIEQLDRNCGEARFVAFQRLNQLQQTTK